MDSSAHTPQLSHTVAAHSSSPHAIAPHPARLTVSPTLASPRLVAGAEVPGVGQACAYWLDKDVLAWPGDLLPTGYDHHGQPVATDEHGPHILPITLSLLTALTGGISVEHGVLQIPPSTVRHSLRLAGSLSQLRPDLAATYPQLRNYLALVIEPSDPLATASVQDLHHAVSGQVAIVEESAAEPTWVTAFTEVQLWPLIDHLWGRSAARRDGSAPLGASFRPLSFGLWAPTAQAVALLTWNTSDPQGSVPCVPGAPQRTEAHLLADGRWEVDCHSSAAHGITEGCQYLWEVSVYVPATGRVERNVVTDPYSRALTLDSERSVAVDLDAPGLMPPTWCDATPPPVRHDAARTIYELHIRDFSARDLSVPERLRGTYRAFGMDSAGTRHLKQLAEAGIDTVHLLPIFDFATVPETPSLRTEPEIPHTHAPDSPAQQAAIAQCAATDSYNWGYDPWHWMAPEGSYATDGHGNGGARTIEVRQMIGDLHTLGFQVVLDQVFNHTAAAGQAEHSVLDKIVPGYYHRLDATGQIETSACGTNVATEHAMAERLMIDACVSWVRDYRVDGFRFDLMGYHSTETMTLLKRALDEAAVAVSPAGAVGHPVFLYGEGWNMGEVANNRLFRQAIQGQTGHGLHVSTFNDRVRDAVVGPQFLSDPRAGQGWGSGAAGEANCLDVPDGTQGAGDVNWQTDLIRLSLVGNLRDWSLQDLPGRKGRREGLSYANQRANYADEPVDALAYVSSHDDETLFDRLAYKLPPSLPMSERVRMNTLCMAAVTLSQSPVLWSAGVELLRSKSLDRDSYNSGDWFNAIDWSCQDNGWGRGLPPAWRNYDRWLIQAPLLARPELRPSAQDIAAARDQALTLLRLRHSSPLITLGSAALIHRHVMFPSYQLEATSDREHDGLILMLISDGHAEQDIDPNLDGVLIALNPYAHTLTVRSLELAGREFRLSPIQAEGDDPVVRETTFDRLSGTLTVPRRSAAVLIEPQ